MEDTLNKKKEVTTVMVDKSTHKILKELAAQHKIPVSAFCAEAALYFKKTGIDPGSTLPESATQAIQKLEKRMIGFIRTQEQEILKPMASDLLEGMKGYFTDPARKEDQNGKNQGVEGLEKTLALGIGKIEKICIRQANEILELQTMQKNTQALMVEFSKDLDAILKKLR